ncbi:GNAT family N-acetyltransferase [candidate division KSB1 bacterium]|nr:MAG: GNAT family N-acetyltransferase [candidate division KSB1 bacterium]MCE7945084.1 GNAT family N-acetyltransferase [Chlorobi bacterium CHB1]
MIKKSTVLQLKIQPLTTARWADFEKLFGERGACGGCWCMFMRLPRATFEQQKGLKNKKAMQKLVKANDVPGLLAYARGEPVGWCSISPREKFSALERSRILQPIDEQPVWSVTCFFIAKGFRRQGVTVELLKAAITYVKKRGGKILEGYPVEPASTGSASTSSASTSSATTADAGAKKMQPDTFMWTGLASAFRKAGFKEILRRSATRPIMRYYVK